MSLIIEAGKFYKTRDGERLVKAHRRDEVDALAQLAEQNGAFPVVMVDGEFRQPIQ